jgi:lysozyme
MTDTLLDLVKQFEGCRLKAYQDIVGVWTIGYGCTGKGIGPGVIWTQDQADEALEERLEVVQSGIENLVTVRISQNQLDALTCLAYNIGLGALAGSTLLRLLNQKKFDEAADQFLRWNKAGGKPVPGLLRRRAAERSLFIA